MNPWKVLAQLDGGVVGRKYLRVSEDHSGVARSTCEQDEVLEADCVENGWRSGPGYGDPGVGASRLSRKRRPDFDALVADLEAGRFEARVLLLWTLNRGSRRVGEWLRLIELCEAREVFIWSHVHARLFDPANANDRRDLIKAAADGEAEASLSGVAIRRANAANAVAGRPHGRIQWGYRRVYDSETREFVAQEIEESEAAMVRELYARLLAGHSLHAIARDFEAAGWRTRSGPPWCRQGLRSVALSPTYAGLRAHIPGRTGGRPKVLELSQLHEGSWPALVEPAEWYKVQRLLCEPDRLIKTRPGRGKYLLSRIASCASCGGLLSVHYIRGTASYVCHAKGCATIRMSLLDDYAEPRMLDYLDDPDVVAALRARDADANDELTAVSNQLGQQRARHDELARGVAAGRVSVALAAKAEPQILAEIAELEKRFAALNTPTALRDLLEPGADLTKRWRDAPMSTRRRAATLLLTPDWMGQLRLKPTPKGRQRVPADERVQWRRARRSSRAGDGPSRRPDTPGSTPRGRAELVGRGMALGVISGGAPPPGSAQQVCELFE